MKPVIVSIGLLIAATLLCACGGGRDGAPAPDTENPVTPPAAAAQADGLEGLELDNGHKWQVDDLTRSLFARMTSTISDPALASAEKDEWHEVGSALQADINDLIQGCSMTGPVHDQLHTYLGVYIPAVAALAESGQMEDAKKVEHYLERYAEYFE